MKMMNAWNLIFVLFKKKSIKVLELVRHILHFMFNLHICIYQTFTKIPIHLNLVVDRINMKFPYIQIANVYNL